jgi:hypothetical protein
MTDNRITDSSAKLRDGKPFFIYALVCPLTLDVKYVGQTVDLEQRVRGKTHSFSENDGPVRQWLSTLGFLRPYRVILEQGINRQVKLKTTLPHPTRGRRPAGARLVWLSSCLEAKWIKRFRRTALNKKSLIEAYEVLTNPPLPWDEQYGS